MQWYKIISLSALAVCFIALLIQVIKIMKLGTPADYSARAGSTRSGIAYSFTGAMAPTKKESALRHLPLYIAGVLYHAGTFLAALLWVLFTSGVTLSSTIATATAFVMAAALLSGVVLLVKRVATEASRSLSTPDDYISNLLVTLFQLFTFLLLYGLQVVTTYYLISAILLLYLPVGKLRHMIWFFAARYHLGYFFGYRGTWPPEKRER